MTRIADKRSILGVDPTSRGLAFVFFEDGELLDWGTRRGDGQEVVVLARALEDLRIDVLVLENPDAQGTERRPRMRRLLRTLAASAKSRGLTVISAGRREIRRKWAAHGRTTKHAVATAIGAMFPELEPLVPKKRKVYRSEEARADIFDAMSLVLHAFPAEVQNSADKLNDRAA